MGTVQGAWGIFGVYARCLRGGLGVRGPGLRESGCKEGKSVIFAGGECLAALFLFLSGCAPADAGGPGRLFAGGLGSRPMTCGPQSAWALMPVRIPGAPASCQLDGGWVLRFGECGASA